MSKERNAYLNWLRDFLNIEVKKGLFGDSMAYILEDEFLRGEYANYVMRSKYESGPFKIYKYGDKRNEWLAIREGAGAGSNFTPFHLMPFWKRVLAFILMIFFFWIIGEIFF